MCVWLEVHKWAIISPLLGNDAQQEMLLYRLMDQCNSTILVWTIQNYIMFLLFSVYLSGLLPWLHLKHLFSSLSVYLAQTQANTVHFGPIPSSLYVPSCCTKNRVTGALIDLLRSLLMALGFTREDSCEGRSQRN